MLAGAVPGLIRHLPQHRPWMVALSLIAAAVVLATCGLGSYLLVRDDSSVVGTAPAATPTVPKRGIDTRAEDPVPLTVRDVFPNAAITADPAIPPYKRIGNPQLHKDCRVAATADLGKLLVSLGCNQVVRATFSSPDDAYLITAGIFNLKDNAAAVKANEEITALVDGSKGRLAGYISHPSTTIVGRAPTQLSWDIYGHFLVYTVIAKSDGQAFASDDPNVPVMRYDIVEKYLRDVVLAAWSIDRSTPSPSPTGTASPTSSL
jgi:hypothetical protein